MKERRGRQRYVVFGVSPDLTKDILIKRFRSVSPENPPYVVQCVSGKAVIRCSPAGRDDVVRIMLLADPSSSSLVASGTIRAVRRKYPELKPAKK
ncbi:MAG: hypothetical protein LBB30_04205 [Candidatus Methanoplasma sp.]|nr:hypothetical protein [Candidatus Methanoplasma sp.]